MPVYTQYRNAATYLESLASSYYSIFARAACLKAAKILRDEADRLEAAAVAP